MAEHTALPRARLQLSTNGLLPEKIIDTVESVLDMGVSLDLGISLDGIGNKHDEIRGVKGNFEKVDSLLEILLELEREYNGRFRVTAGSTLTNATLPSALETREYAKKLGIDFVYHWYNESSFYGNEGKRLVSDNKALSAVIQIMPQSLYRNMWLKWLDGRPSNFSCFSMHTFCVLKCNGDISPCLTHWNVKIGNVRESTPSEIWSSKRAEEARNLVKNCDGCLNSWGVGWSMDSNISTYPIRLAHLLRREFGRK
jgi:MoaA/NifB/PqqE/SkfB family radical SAM enzyme